VTARLVVVASGDPGQVGDAMLWARTPVRVVTPTPGWVWLLPHGEGPVAMDRVVEEASDVAPALLVTVTPWRSELQLWRGEKPVRTLAWESGTVSGLDSDESMAAASDLVELLAGQASDPAALVRALSRQLAGPRPGTAAWRDVVDLLQIPVPAGFVELRAAELAAGQGRVVHTTGLLDAVRTPTAAEEDAKRRTDEALARAPRAVARIRTTAVVATALAAWLTASSRSWIPLAVGAVVLTGCLVAAARISSGRGPGRPPDEG
jgi:hypothetical protein